MTTAGVALIDPHIVFEKIALGHGCRVADFGCGRTGHFVFPASRAVGDTGVVYAIDVIKNILESLQSRVRSEGYANVQTVWSDIELFGKTPIPAESLDFAFMVNVVSMLKEQQVALKEVTRLLKREGKLVMVEWARNLGPLGPKFEAMVLPEKAALLGQAARLDTVDEFPLGDYHYCIVFKKT